MRFAYFVVRNHNIGFSNCILSPSEWSKLIRLLVDRTSPAVASVIGDLADGMTAKNTCKFWRDQTGNPKRVYLDNR